MLSKRIFVIVVTFSKGLQAAVKIADFCDVKKKVKKPCRNLCNFDFKIATHRAITYF